MPSLTRTRRLRSRHTARSNSLLHRSVRKRVMLRWHPLQRKVDSRTRIC